ncbi:carboxymuconolactone decarboxylase family protein [Rosenbergiella collisarenosi]|uniref:carboxymuconolactone decarboxylase family protein n=1 Tax=Rosenbergiella collisarenosi TaxID=1544695 RepID=UPI001BDA2842|nr:carboxymuconolactone decarboxylase family protein [Rosenbergiella collisarenosi]MBT0720204.1 4-carboxymuconolactone decarboxylase [Rosenbergiella collisarenosi]
MSSTLNSFQHAIIPIAASSATGDISRLTEHLDSALNQQLPISMAKEVMVHLYAYVGFPRSLNALNTLMTLVDKRRDQGLNDVPGDVEQPEVVLPNSLQIGTENQTKLAGQPVSGPLFSFAPAIDHFLKAHLFGDLFQRTQLSWIDRELTTLSALSVLTGVESQLKSHFQISLNAGLTPTQLHEFISILRLGCDPLAADSAEKILLSVL